MSTELMTAFIGFLGIVIGVIPTYFFMRQRSIVEIEKLQAETDKTKAEAEKIRFDLRRIEVTGDLQVQRATNNTKEPTNSIAGTYQANGNPNNLVFVHHIFENQYRLEQFTNWYAVGIFDGETYFGVFRYKDTVPDPRFRGVWGIHKATLRADGSFAVHGTNMINMSGEWDMLLQRAR